MKAVIISESGAETELSEKLKTDIITTLSNNGDEVESVELQKDRVAPCLGCFRCATTHRGDCVSRDAVREIKLGVKELGLTVYLTPVVFGHYSSTIKNAVDRGTGSHQWQMVIGYGAGLDDEERSTFIDLSAKHRGRADIVHPGMDARVDAYVTGSAEENAAICEDLRDGLRNRARNGLRDGSTAGGRP
jgi:multimeric flavodoxin WrbA